MIRLLPDTIALAIELGRYPRLNAASLTFVVVLIETDAPGVNTLLTADWETPASSATSADVTFEFYIPLSNLHL